MNGQKLSLEEQAAAWVARMDADDWSDEQECELQAWLKSGPLVPGALLKAQAVWIATGNIAEIADVDIPYRRFGRRRFLAVGGAAFAASVAAGFFWFDTGKHYETEVGEIRQVPLVDGSMIAINTASSLDVALARSRRDVRLDRGEAWFKVAKDPARPFVVEAGRVSVQAVGTAFSVHRRNDGAEVLVTEGVVEAWAAEGAVHRIRLVAGQRAFLAPNAVARVQTAGNLDISRALAWRGGKIDIVGQTLGDAIDDFNRYNKRQIIVLDPAIAAERFDGVFNTNEPEIFANAVKNSLDVPVSLDHPDKIFIGKERP